MSSSPSKALLSGSEKTLLMSIIVYSFIPAFAGLFRILELINGTEILPANPRALADPFPIVVHILSSFVFCIFGAVLFLPSIRRKRPEIHRMTGRAVAIAGCLSGATGLWMTAFYSFPIGLQGTLLYLARIILGVAMIGFICRGVIAIKSRNVARHRASMLRAYAIGQGASTQTFLGIGWMLFTGVELLGTLRDLQMIFAWVLNLIVAEYLIRKFLQPHSLATKKVSAVVS